MINKKTKKITLELIAKRRVICIRPTMPQEKKMKEKEENISDMEQKKYEVFRKKEAARVREWHYKKEVREITGQHCNLNLRNNTNHVFSIFSKTDFEPKCSQD